jgi:alcohol dehydrogenase
MNGFDYQPGPRVVFGEGALFRLGEFAKNLNAHRALIVSDSGIVQTGYAERAETALREASVESFLFKDVQENPTTKVIEAGAKFAAMQGSIDLIIGLGGGSSMDCAKGINFLLTNGGKMEDYWGFNKATKPMLPSIGIPTTAGTGSEAQSYALISQEHTHIKMACGDVKARFQIVILDPVLTLTAPAEVTAVSGIDAVGHAVETFVTKTRNPLSKMYSSEAWTLLSRSFAIVLREPANLNARADMLLGSHFAGVAIEYSMLGAAHACANPLTARYGVQHGVAVGVMLPAVITFNKSIVGDEYEQLSQDLRSTIINMQQQASLPMRLRDLSVDRSVLPDLAREATEQWTAKHNPRPVEEQDLLHLYESSY